MSALRRAFAALDEYAFQRRLERRTPNGLPESLRKRIVIDEDGCWICTVKWDSGNGYGKVSYLGATWMFHRLVYTLLVGRIPTPLVLDHKCRKRRCCRPACLRVTTVKDNTHRGNAVLFKKVRHG